MITDEGEQVEIKSRQNKGAFRKQKAGLGECGKTCFGRDCPPSRGADLPFGSSPESAGEGYYITYLFFGYNLSSVLQYVYLMALLKVYLKIVIGAKMQ